MPLNQDLLEILACPKCKGKLEYRESESRLLCRSCLLAYEIKDGIPVMLIEQAKAI
jgi:uncharacterized protein